MKDISPKFPIISAEEEVIIPEASSFSDFVGQQNINTPIKVQQNHVESADFLTGSTGWRFDAVGNLEANDGNFRGDITGASGTFSGTITATTGAIGGWSIGSTSITAYGGSAGATNTGATSPQTASNDDSVGTSDWINVDNIKTSNDSWASGDLRAPSTSKYLTGTNYGFTVPTGATINGIKVEIEESTGPYGSVENSVKILKGGTISGDEQSTGATLPTNDTYVTYGGTTDLWGETWTAEDINLATFGVGFSAVGGIASVDHIRITVYYTTAGTTKDVITHTYVIEGDGDYVDTGQKVSIGSTTIGSKVIGGGGSTEASPFEISFPINSDRFVDVRIKVEAVGIGFAQINSFRFHDIRDKGVHNLPTRTT